LNVVIIVAFLVVIAVIGALIYLLLVHREVPGAVEQRFGVWEPLPPDVGKWKDDLDSEEGRAAARQGLKREVRVFHDAQSGKLSRQARYRNPATNAIARVDPDVVVPRRRLKDTKGTRTAHAKE
jgi:hypothetical protein